MTAELDQGSEVTLHLAEECLRPAMAAPVLAQKLGIPLAEATERLRSLSGPITGPLPPRLAERLHAILSALGVNLDIHHRPPRTLVYDLSIQTAIWADLPRIAERLCHVIDVGPGDVLKQLAQPSGLVLSGLSAETATNLETRLRRIKGLVFRRVDTRNLQLDLFATRPLLSREWEKVGELQTRLGLSGDAFSGAVLSGLGQNLCDRVLDALQGLELISVHRSFERFDLYLTGFSGWMTKDLADFLAARTSQPRARFELLSPDVPVQIDSALPYQHARRFCADYAAIGLFVRPLLRGLPKNPENPKL